MKHNVMYIELLSKDVSNMIQSLDIPEVSRVITDVLRREKV